MNELLYIIYILAGGAVQDGHNLFFPLFLGLALCFFAIAWGKHRDIKKQRQAWKEAEDRDSKPLPEAPLWPGCWAGIFLMLSAVMLFKGVLPSMKRASDWDSLQASTRGEGDFATYKGYYDAFKIHGPDGVKALTPNTAKLDKDRAARLHLLLGERYGERDISINFDALANWLLQQEASEDRRALLLIMGEIPPTSRHIKLDTYLRYEAELKEDKEVLAALQPPLQYYLKDCVLENRMDLFAKGLELGGNPYSTKMAYINQWEMAAFFAACMTDNEEALRLILAWREPTPEELNKALALGDSAKIGALWLKRGAQPDVLLPWLMDDKEQQKDTALHTALLAGNFTRAQQLLAAGAKPTTRDFRGRTALHYALVVHAPQALWQQLLTDETLTSLDDDGMSPLHWAAFAGNVPAVQTLLARLRQQQKIAEFIDLEDKQAFTPAQLALMGSWGPGFTILREQFPTDALRIILWGDDAPPPWQVAAQKSTSVLPALGHRLPHLFLYAGQAKAYVQDKATVVRILTEEGAILQHNLPQKINVMRFPLTTFQFNWPQIVSREKRTELSVTGADYTSDRYKDLGDIYNTGMNALLDCYMDADLPLERVLNDNEFYFACVKFSPCKDTVVSYAKRKGLKLETMWK